MVPGLWKTLVMAGLVAGLMAAGLLTATAASEGKVFKGPAAAAVQSAPGQQGTLSDPPGPPIWAWTGKVDDTEEGGFILEGPCGKWALSPANEEIRAALVARVDQRAILIGHIATEANTAQRPTIQVTAVKTERAEIPEGVKFFPKCNSKQDRPEGKRPEKAPAALLGLLERTAFQGLQGVPRDQRFEHFLGAEVELLDKDGVPFVTRLIAGVATSATTDSLTLDPNGPETGLTVNTTSQTKVMRPGNGGVEAIQPGDKVLVLQVNGQTELIVASKQVTATIWPPMLGSMFGQGGGYARTDKLKGVGLNATLSNLAADLKEGSDNDARLSLKTDDKRTEVPSKNGKSELVSRGRHDED